MPEAETAGIDYPLSLTSKIMLFPLCYNAIFCILVIKMSCRCTLSWPIIEVIAIKCPNAAKATSCTHRLSLQILFPNCVARSGVVKLALAPRSKKIKACWSALCPMLYIPLQLHPLLSLQSYLEQGSIKASILVVLTFCIVLCLFQRYIHSLRTKATLTIPDVIFAFLLRQKRGLIPSRSKTTFLIVWLLWSFLRILGLLEILCICNHCLR